MNARIEIYRIKAGLFKKLQCARAVLYNAEFCSWHKAEEVCQGLKSYDEGFYKNLTQFKCNMNPVLPRRFDFTYTFFTKQVQLLCQDNFRDRSF